MKQHTLIEKTDTAEPEVRDAENSSPRSTDSGFQEKSADKTEATSKQPTRATVDVETPKSNHFRLEWSSFTNYYKFTSDCTDQRATNKSMQIS